MEPIINPMFFYWMNIVDNFWRFSIFIAIVGGVSFVIASIALVVNTYQEDNNGKFISKKVIKIASPIFVLLFFSLF